MWGGFGNEGWPREKDVWNDEGVSPLDTSSSATLSRLESAEGYFHTCLGFFHI